MKLLGILLSKRKQEKPKTLVDYQREKLVHLGRQQFQKLMELGVGTPIRLV